GPIYHQLGMTVAIIGHEMSLLYDPDYLDETHPDPRLQHLRPITRPEAYQADITYGTNSEFGFDYLRDNMAVDLTQCVQRTLNFAIVDEAHQINQALKAYTLYKRDRDYLVKDGEVIIVDEFTGRQQPGRRWADGLHQAVEAKEGVKVQQETQTMATITYQNYFRLYKKLAGMTGTAVT